MTSLTMSPYGPGHTPTSIVVVPPSCGLSIWPEAAAAFPPHAAVENSTHAASAAAMVETGVRRVMIAMMVVLS